jgi:protein-tyrosine phosphatase
VRLLFVCLGNICRSPTAEGTMRALVREAGLQEEIEIDSAGTGGWHVGSRPDARAAAAARARGIALEGTAREVGTEDFQDFDLLIAMDRSNLRALRQLAPSEAARAKVRLLREFDPASTRRAHSPSAKRRGSDTLAPASARADPASPQDLDVPDPYYGAAGGFEEVLDLVQVACRGLLEHIRQGDPA